MLGVPTERFKLFGFMLSALITGLVGATYAFSLGYITTNSVFRTDISFNVIVYTLLGGIGTLAGPTGGENHSLPTGRWPHEWALDHTANQRLRAVPGSLQHKHQLLARSTPRANHRTHTPLMELKFHG